MWREHKIIPAKKLRLKPFEMSCFKRVLKIKLVERITNEEIVNRIIIFFYSYIEDNFEIGAEALAR